MKEYETSAASDLSGGVVDFEQIENLDDVRLYLNRELSQIRFVQRVLAQAKDVAVPLLERLRFSRFAVRFSMSFSKSEWQGSSNASTWKLPASGPDGMAPPELLRSIRRSVRDLIEEQYAILNDVLLPALADKDIHLLRRMNSMTPNGPGFEIISTNRCFRCSRRLDWIKPIHFPTW